MRSLLFLLATGALACARGDAPDAEAAARLRSTREDSLRAVLERFQTASKFPGAVASAWFADSTSVTVAVGLADREAGTPMRPDAKLHAGSVGKTFFAGLILQLVGEGRLGLDDSVSKYLGAEPWYRDVPNATGITVRSLLNHTSGISEYGGDFMTELINDPGRVRRPLDAVRSVSGAKPVHPVGARFTYSDINYQLLQLLAEKITGQSAYIEISNRLLTPNGLASVVPATQKSIAGLVQGYAGAGGFLGFDAVQKDGQLILDPTFEGGGGGFVTNAADLAKWMPLFTDAKVYPDSLRPQVVQGVAAGQLDVGKDAQAGLGLEFAPTPLGTAYGHGGFFPGYLSLVLYYPDVGISLAIQVNSSAADALARPLREVLLEAAAALGPLAGVMASTMDETEN